MDAEEAREMSYITRAENLEAIYTAIRKRTEAGQFELDIGLNCITFDQVQLLENQGFNCTPTANNCGYIISWEVSDE